MDPARGFVPFDQAPTCNGTPSFTRWVLSVSLQNGSLVGTYTEETRVSIDRTPTRASWNVTLARG